METILIAALFVLVIIAVVVVFRHQIALKIRLPGAGLEVAGNNRSQAQTIIKDVEAQRGNVKITDEVAEKFEVEHIKGGKDIEIIKKAAEEPRPK